MRHVRSILYALVLAPAAWVLTGAGLTSDLATRGRDDFAVETYVGLLMLLLAGAAYGILIFAPISPAGPTLAGVVFLGVTLWALNAPDGYANAWPSGVSKEGFDLSRPGYGVAALLAVPLVCTALSVRRWQRYEPVVLPIIGQIGRARGSAAVAGTPIGATTTAVLGTGAGMDDPEPTTVLRVGGAASDGDRTTVLPPGGAGADHTTVLPPSGAGADHTTVLPDGTAADGTTVLPGGTADEHTTVLPSGAADEHTTVLPGGAAADRTTSPDDEHTVALRVGGGGTVAVPLERPKKDQAEGTDEPETEPVVAAEKDETAPITAEEPQTEPITAEEPETEPITAEEPETEPITAAGGPGTAVVADGDEPDTEHATAVDEPSTEPIDTDHEPETEPVVAVGEDVEQTRNFALGDPDRTGTVPDHEEVTRHLAPVEDIEQTRNFALGDPDRTDAVPDHEEVTRSLALGDPARAGAVPIPVDDGERTQVIRSFDPEQTMAITGLGKPPGEVTQVITPVAGMGEGTRRIAPATRSTVEPPGERTQVFRTPSIAAAEAPDFAEDPTGRIVPPEAGQRPSATVADEERPADETRTIPIQRRAAEEEQATSRTDDRRM